MMDRRCGLIAPPPLQIIGKSIVGAGLLAHVLVTKFADAVPSYQQEGQFLSAWVVMPRESANRMIFNRMRE